MRGGGTVWNGRATAQKNDLVLPLLLHVIMTASPNQRRSHTNCLRHPTFPGLPDTIFPRPGLKDTTCPPTQKEPYNRNVDQPNRISSGMSCFVCSYSDGLLLPAC